MGKSNKKVKNERINAIRKQYDAFLEEDRKRRERNEYILGRLDKMRSSTALVPVASKANYYAELNPSEILMRTNTLKTKSEFRNSYLSNLERQNVTLGIGNKPMGELQVLKEISKKYILIPRRSTLIENEYVYSKDIIDDDWKSKYNILDDLKKQEKEGQSEPVFRQMNNDKSIHNETINLSMDPNISDKQPQTISNDRNDFDTPIPYDKNELMTATKPNNSFVEQNKDNKKVNFEISEINNPDNEESNIPIHITSMPDEDIKAHSTQSLQNTTQELIFNPQQEEVTEKEKYNSESNEKDINTINNFNDNRQIHAMDNNNPPLIYDENVNLSHYNEPTVETNKYVAHENINADIENVAFSDQTISDEKPQESGTVAYAEETVHPDHNIDNQIDKSGIQDLTSTGKVELYDDTDINPESQIKANEPTSDLPHHYDPTQNTNTADVENVHHPEHVEHESEINAFETEQKEMFYSEQDNPDSYAYNQGEGNIGEYAENYEQNDYAYYEGVQQDQSYAANINEHEEATERYDPHYNQQYEGSYENPQPENITGYENTNEYEQQQFQGESQQFENIANYENQQENAQLYQQENVTNENEVQDPVSYQDEQMYNQHLYAEHSGTQEDIEQQLIAEEGYIENPPEITNDIQKDNEGDIENVTNTMRPEEPLVEPKVT